MIDPDDKQTQGLNLEEPKRGRGRPKTGKAMSAAEKQRRYRERKAAEAEDKGFGVAGLKHALELARAENKELKQRLVVAEAQVLNLKKGNVTGIQLTGAETTAIVALLQDKAKHMSFSALGSGPVQPGTRDDQVMQSVKWVRDLVQKVASAESK